ncbi:hypothetical protein [Methanobrevibacter sp. UBA212]|uniref:hypothetical protein n=1 Tax=Methanobrevibacter sp. UBA212 TaxID=1915476 RepID=UPI0025FBF37E|nr:hypothetical protein [Methanobrevibacter sp. UBA212]
MFQTDYKKIAMILLIIAGILLVSAIILLQIIPKDDSLNESIKTIAIPLLINIISSIIIISLIDFKREAAAQKELEEKRKFIYSQLIIPIIEFDKFILNMYKSTVTYDEMKSLEYNLENVPMMVNKIKLIDTNKESYIGNLVTTNNNESYIGNLVTTQLWRETIARQLMSFFEDISNFHRYYSYFLTNDLICDFNEILKIYNGTNNILGLMLNINATFKMEDIIKIFKLEKLIESSFKIKHEISKYYDEDPFKINNENLLKEDDSPRFKSGLTDKE